MEEEVDPSKDIPCPKCGSLLRDASITVHASINASLPALRVIASASVKNPSINLLLQAVIVPVRKVSEGTLIETVTIPWFEIIKLIKSDPAMAYQISPRKWEEIVAGAYIQSGFDEVIITPGSGDRGRDVIAVKQGLGRVRIIDQVKAYKANHLVTANDVRALMGVLHEDGASKGFLTTTSDFAPGIKKDPLIVPFIPSRLELINGVDLIKRLEELSKKRS